MASLRHRLEFAALLGVKGLAGLLPYRAALALGWLLAVLGFRLLRFRRAEAVRRIRSVFGPELTARRAEAIAWEAFLNFIFTAIESMRGEKVDEAWLQAHLDEAGFFEALRRHTAESRGAILALPHMGSWELAGAACRVRHVPLFSIAGKQKNPLFNDYLNRQRSRSGIDILVRGDATLKQALRNLKQGRHFAILPDVRMPTPGLLVPFLGSIANVGAGMALFARLANAPLYPVLLKRKGWTRHTLRLLDPVLPDPAASREADLQRMTAEVFARFEQAIRANPGQWFWYNKRWILDPVAPEAAAPSEPPV
jgi:KDO2-lipid IV(A) lauroyltransferase